jgi:hypothetical protein
MKVSELQGAFLDFWVGKALGADVELKTDFSESTEDGLYVRRWTGCEGARTDHEFSPTTNWLDGGPIIEREAIGIMPISDAEWLAEEFITCARGRGPTPLIAAMRAYVASKFGEELPAHPAAQQQEEG